MKISDSRIKPTFELEAAEHQLGSRPIAGVDEAGRGPWAGPVVAAAVILNPDKIPANIDDSKALDEDSRAFLYRRIMKVAIVAVGIADVDRIDRENILGATLWAMAQAVSQLGEAPKLVLVDGDKTPRIPMSVRAMKAGATDFLIKPFRDQDMLDAVEAAITRDRSRRNQRAAAMTVETLAATLTPREREVMAEVVKSRLNKQIAGDLGISEVTVKLHRGKVMRKMQVRSVADLVRKVEVLDQQE